MSDEIRRTLLAGIGNPMRGDDAVGLYIAEEIAERNLPGFDVKVFLGEATNLVAFLEQYDRLIVVDAASSGAMAGTLHRFDVTRCVLPSALFGMSTHWYGLTETIELARLLKVLPGEAMVIGIEGSRWETGQAISDPVRKAAATLIDELSTSARLPVRLSVQ